MMKWLLEDRKIFPDDVEIDMLRRWVLVHRPERPPVNVPGLLRLLRRFIKHVPTVLSDLYGAPESDRVGAGGAGPGDGARERKEEP